MSIKGIDVSSYQGTIDWKKVKAAGVGFAILKVIRKDLNPDKQFETNWCGCVQAGMTIQGVYNYSYATTVAKAKTDAQKVVGILGADRHPMVWLDVEDSCQKGLGQKLVDIILAYREVITAAGMPFGVYTGLSFFKSYIKPFEAQIEEIPFWIARYPSDSVMAIGENPAAKYKPEIIPEMFGWQYSSKGSVPGIAGNVDMNYWYADIEAGIAAGRENTNAQIYGREVFLSDSSGVWKTTDFLEMLCRTVTVGTARNNSHAIVTPLERYMKALGYYTGKVEADEGRKPLFGNGMKKAICLYQRNEVRAKERNCDGVLTAGAATWKHLYS